MMTTILPLVRVFVAEIQVQREVRDLNVSRWEIRLTLSCRRRRIRATTVGYVHRRAQSGKGARGISREYLFPGKDDLRNEDLKGRTWSRTRPVGSKSGP